METLKNIDDRYLLLFLAIFLVVCWLVTRDPALTESMNYVLVVVAVLLRDRSNKVFVAGTDEKSAAMVKEFFGGRS